MDWRRSFCEMKKLHTERLEDERRKGAARNYSVRGRSKWASNLSSKDIEEIAFIEAEADVQQAINRQNERVRKHGQRSED